MTQQQQILLGLVLVGAYLAYRNRDRLREIDLSTLPERLTNTPDTAPTEQANPIGRYDSLADTLGLDDHFGLG